MTFSKILYKDENTGAIDLAFDPANPQVIYASLWAAREGPWENAQFEGIGSGLYKSTDGGNTWRQIGKGMPEPVQRIGIGIAPSLPSRMFATVGAKKDGGLYRSDDAGETWLRISEDSRSEVKRYVLVYMPLTVAILGLAMAFVRRSTENKKRREKAS